MMKKLLPIFFIVFLIQNVSAFLISPPKIEVQFQPGFTEQYTITLFNNRDENINLQTYVRYTFLSSSAQEALNNSVVLSQSTISFTPSELSKSFVATLTLPGSVPDGLHDIRIGAVEEAVSGVVGSRSANEVRLLVMHGIIQEATTSIRRERNETSPGASLPGSQQGSGPGLIVEQRPSTFTLQVVTTTTLFFLLAILFILFYLLLLRRVQLTIVSLIADYNKQDKNTKIEAVIRNKSLELIDNVYLDLLIIGADLNILKTINIGPIKLKPRYEGIVQRVWEAKDAKTGTYTVRAMLYHHKKTLIKEKSFQLS